MPRMRVCSKPGCPTLTTDRRCTEHQAQYERDRGTRQERGYDAHHDALRAQWQAELNVRPIPCWRCKELIYPGYPWHLGHDDDDRTVYRGPEHELCNTRAAGRASHRHSS